MPNSHSPSGDGTANAALVLLAPPQDAPQHGLHVDNEALVLPSEARRRAHRKRPPTAADLAAPRAQRAGPELAEGGVPEPAAGHLPVAAQIPQQFPDDVQWTALSKKQQWDWVWEKVRMWKTAQYVADSADPEGDQHSEQQRYREARRTFSQMTKEAKKAAVREWLLLSAAPDYVWSRMSPRSSPLLGCTRHAGAMLTYNFPQQDDWQGLQTRVPALAVARLRQIPSVVELWKEMLVYTTNTAEKINAQHHAVCLELCNETLELSGEVRLHMHIFFKSTTKLRIPPLGQLCFRLVRPNMATMTQGLVLARNERAWAGYFYCCVEKIGQLWNASSRKPFKDFLVQSTWIMNLLQGRKITHEVARSLVLQTCTNVRKQLGELDALEREQELQTVRAAQQEAMLVLSQGLKEWAQVPVAIAWERQYSAIRSRYSFLVLSGPTQMGKTMYARSLTPEGKEFLEINCSAGHEPDLRAFRFSRHGLVLFDEIEAHQVARQRKLFQASPAMVHLGASATNCHGYEVYCHRVRFVLSSNSWESSLADLLPDDRAWVIGNSFYVRVDRPLWVDS